MANRGRVLIVDDDPVIRELMALSLEGQGCDVSWVGSAAEALPQALAQPPDLILLDLLLPDVDGIEVCRRVRAEPLLAEVPVIMVTALNDPEARLHSLDAGVDDFVTKPIDFIELRARVSSILRLNRYRRLLDERTQRQRAEEEILRRNRELSLLNAFIVSAADQLRTAGRIDEALRDACRVLVQVLDLFEARAWLLPEEGADLVSASALAEPVYGHNGTVGGQLQLSFDLARLLAAGAQPPARDAIAGLPLALLAQMPAPEPAPGGRSLFSVSLALDGHPRGAITLVAAEGRVFDSQERAFAQSLAGALGQAVEAALLQRRLRDQLDSLEGMVAARTYELQAERDRTQAILDALGEGVIVTDADWVIRYINPAMSALTGHSGAELLGRAWSELQADSSTAALYRIIRDHAGAGGTWRGEVSGVRRDGSRYDAAMTVAPIFDPRSGERPIGLVSIQRDITPLKAAERTKDRFISNVSHELRTPLSIIALHSGNLDTLYERLDDERRRKLIREVRVQAGLLDELIGDLLELSRIDSGRLPVDSEQLDLAELLRHEVERLLPLAERKGLSLEVVAGASLSVLGDRAHLCQCIRNLVGNAIKFTPSGGSIRCECREMGQGPVEQGEWPAFLDIDAGRWVGLRVVDSGVGIDAIHLPRLFERFYRVHDQGSVPGTGLGLAITRELITRQGGWTGVSSTPGVGSVFVFYLPLSAAARR